MSGEFMVGDDGACRSCKSTSHTGECVQCFACECYFHAICENATYDNKLASKTMITTFLAVSTKNNFKFYCDTCLTNLEISNAESTSEKVATLEKKYISMETKLEEIKELLIRKEEKQTITKEFNNNSPTIIWNNQDKLEAIKAPPSKSVLIIKDCGDQNKRIQNRTIIEDTILKNKISVTKSYETKSGDLSVVCESQNTRDKLKNLVSSATDDDIKFITPQEKRSSVTIVGLTKEYKKEEIYEMLPRQNDYIRTFSLSNNIEEHLLIYAIRPCKRNPQIFQIFATASPIFRQGLQLHNDRLTLGLTTCRVYDRYHIKRCNICQQFGHYAKECPTPDYPTCSECSENHLTENCDSSDQKCINCTRNKEDNKEHTATSFKCPSFIKQQNQLKTKLNSYHLNMENSNTFPHR